jgi:hypothetical protein
MPGRIRTFAVYFGKTLRYTVENTYPDGKEDFLERRGRETRVSHMQREVVQP